MNTNTHPRLMRRMSNEHPGSNNFGKAIMNGYRPPGPKFFGPQKHVDMVAGNRFPRGNLMLLAFLPSDVRKRAVPLSILQTLQRFTFSIHNLFALN